MKMKMKIPTFYNIPRINMLAVKPFRNQQGGQLLGGGCTVGSHQYRQNRTNAKSPNPKITE